MIARDAEHGLVERAQRRVEVRVAARVVLDDVAGDDQRIGRGDVGSGGVQHRMHRGQGLQPAQVSRFLAEEVGVGELQEAHSLHVVESFRGSVSDRFRWVRVTLQRTQNAATEIDHHRLGLGSGQQVARRRRIRPDHTAGAAQDGEAHAPSLPRRYGQ